MGRQFTTEELATLKSICPGTLQAEEGGVTFFLLPRLKLPPGCEPSEVDALLCPTSHSGYNSRLFFAQVVKTPQQRNWNGNTRVLERNWHAFSWQFETAGLNVVQILQVHLDGLK